MKTSGEKTHQPNIMLISLPSCVEQPTSLKIPCLVALQLLVSLFIYQCFHQLLPGPCKHCKIYNKVIKIARQSKAEVMLIRP